jgi:hypothetical protein
MNDKIQIRIICPACSGHVYLSVRNEIGSPVSKYTRPSLCSACGGTGKQTQWISSVEYASMLLAFKAEKQP